MSRFIVMTDDGSGTGWAKKLQEEGEDCVLVSKPELGDNGVDDLELVGDGWFPTMSLLDAMNKFIKSDTYWIPDRNCFVAECDQLRQRGQKVFNTTELTAKMEHDRQYAVELADEYGLRSPETWEFSDVKSALEFLDKNQARAFVFKPNNSDKNDLTFVPFREEADHANRELYVYLKHLIEGIDKGFILQERKSGVEVNVELWLYRGVPFFAMVTLENKRKNDHDTGPMSGCASDVTFPIPLDSKLVNATIGRMLPFYQKQEHTGFVDVNVIIGDGEVWFLEVCNRLGYSSHPTLFLGLGLTGFGSVIADWCDGAKELINCAYDKFRAGFGASTTCFHDRPRFGLPLYLKPRWEGQFYPFDGCKVGDDLLLTGYSHEIGVFIDHDYTIEQAAENCLMKLLHQEAVSFPDISFRTDLGRRDYHGAVLNRYNALKSMGLL